MGWSDPPTDRDFGRQGTMYTGPKANASERRRYALSSLGIDMTTVETHHRC